MKEFDAEEIPSEKEIKKQAELDVPLPADNEDFNSLARKLSKSLPRDASVPGDAAALPAWQTKQRGVLRDVLKLKDYQVTAIREASEEKPRVQAVFWRLQMDGAWTVPAVELSAPAAKRTVVLLSDRGRAAMVAEVTKLLDAGNRVLAVDPFYFGESKPYEPRLPMGAVRLGRGRSAVGRSSGPGGGGGAVGGPAASRRAVDADGRRPAHQHHRAGGRRRRAAGRCPRRTSRGDARQSAPGYRQELDVRRKA